jgi:hypothetical protein
MSASCARAASALLAFTGFTGSSSRSLTRGPQRSLNERFMRTRCKRFTSFTAELRTTINARLMRKALRQAPVSQHLESYFREAQNCRDKKTLMFVFAFPVLSGKFGKQSLGFRAAKTFFFGITVFLYQNKNPAEFFFSS